MTAPRGAKCHAIALPSRTSVVGEADDELNAGHEDHPLKNLCHVVPSTTFCDTPIALRFAECPSSIRRKDLMELVRSGLGEDLTDVDFDA